MTTKIRATVTVETRGENHIVSGDVILAHLAAALAGRTFRGQVTLAILGNGDILAVDEEQSQSLRTVVSRTQAVYRG